MKTTYNGNGCIPNQVLVAYLKGELSSKEAHLVERHVTDCPMCADELEGLSLLANPEQINTIENKLNKQIDKRLASPFIHRANRTTWLRIAATLLLFVGVSSLVMWVSITNNRNDMFQIFGISLLFSKCIAYHLNILCSFWNRVGFCNYYDNWDSFPHRCCL